MTEKQMALGQLK